MKTEFIFIDEATKSKKTLICFLIVLTGIIFSVYNQVYFYNNFFLNIYNIFTSFYFLLAIVFVFFINNLNILEEISKKDLMTIRLSKTKKNNFITKEVILANLYICLLTTILVIAFSFLFSGTNYNMYEIINNINIWKIDCILLIVFFITFPIFGLILIKIIEFINLEK